MGLQYPRRIHSTVILHLLISIDLVLRPVSATHSHGLINCCISSKSLISSILIPDYPCIPFRLTPCSTSAQKMIKHTWIFNPLAFPPLHCYSPFHNLTYLLTQPRVFGSFLKSSSALPSISFSWQDSSAT